HVGPDAEVVQLPPFGLRDRQHTRGIIEDPLTEDEVVRALDGAPTFDSRRRAVRSQHVRNPGSLQMVRRNRADPVATGMEMRDVEVPSVSPHVALEVKREKQLKVIRETV